MNIFQSVNKLNNKKIIKGSILSGKTFLSILLLLVFVPAVVLGQATTTTKATTEPPKTETKTTEKKITGEEFSEYEKPEGWRIQDFKPYEKSFLELERLSDERSLMILQQAKDDFNFGLGILLNMENDIIKYKNISRERKNLEERWYWQVIDRKNQEARVVNRKKREAKIKSITYFTKAIQKLDKVQNNKVRASDDFQKFQGNLFKIYVSTQYDLTNFSPCIPILNRYLKIRKENEMDIWAHRYLASCYAFQEKALMLAHNSPESEVLRFRKLKNDHLLEAAKIKFPDPDSPERKQIFQIISEDSINTAPINNYK
jgi:hypothetical protein